MEPLIKLLLIALCISTVWSAPQLHDDNDLQDIPSEQKTENEFKKEVLKSNHPHQDEYEQFLKDFGKAYDTEEEKLERLEYFVKSLLTIEEMSEKMPTAELGLTKFADWRECELRATIMQNTKEAPPDDDQANEKSNVGIWNRVRAGITTVNVDWRTKNVVGPVKDQGQCGSCWAFATMSTVETALALKQGTTNVADFSEQELVDCDTTNSGCEGGLPYKAIQYLEGSGAMNESTYPYTQTDGICRSTPSTTKPTGFLQFQGASDMENYLMNNGTLTICIWVQSDFYMYKSGIYSPPSCSSSTALGGHAMTAVGYGTDNGVDYWLIKNSWGTDFGDNGYLKILRGQNTCLIEQWCPTAPTF